MPPADPDSPDESVTRWLGHLKAGDRAAAQPLWERYFDRLVRVARGRLSARIRRAADEEDVALSAFDSFVRAAEAGRFPRLDDRDDLWAVLVTLTERKANARVDRETAKKRGGGAVRGDSVLGPDAPGGGYDAPAPDPTPAMAAEVAEECERLLAALDAHGPDLRPIALWKLEGYSNAEIAAKAGKSVATVERKLALIRSLWAAVPGV
jgi:DNA-directed RNA polymerase specialized sigma24 family protein